MPSKKSEAKATTPDLPPAVPQSAPAKPGATKAGPAALTPEAPSTGKAAAGAATSGPAPSTSPGAARSAPPPTAASPADPSPFAPSADRETRIRERAYAIWERKGHQDGTHEDHWHEAAREIDEEDGKGAPGSPSDPPAA